MVHLVHSMGSLPSGQRPPKPAPAPVPGPGLGRTKDHTQVFAQRNPKQSQDNQARDFARDETDPGPDLGSRPEPDWVLGPRGLGVMAQGGRTNWILYVIYFILFTASLIDCILFILFLCAE